MFQTTNQYFIWVRSVLPWFMSWWNHDITLVLSCQERCGFSCFSQLNEIHEFEVRILPFCREWLITFEGPDIVYTCIYVYRYIHIVYIYNYVYIYTYVIYIYTLLRNAEKGRKVKSYTIYRNGFVASILFGLLHYRCTYHTWYIIFYISSPERSRVRGNRSGMTTLLEEGGPTLSTHEVLLEPLGIHSRCPSQVHFSLNFLEPNSVSSCFIIAIGQSIAIRWRFPKIWVPLNHAFL